MAINAYYDPKPIPIRDFDWVATPDDFDAELIDGRWVSSYPIGYGATEQEAIDDLNEKLREQEEEVRGNRRSFWGIQNGGR